MCFFLFFFGFFSFVFVSCVGRVVVGVVGFL